MEKQKPYEPENSKGSGDCRRNVLGKPIGLGRYNCATATYFSEDAIIAWQSLPEPCRTEN